MGGDRILRFKLWMSGVAVAIDGGWLTPVIRNAETKSLRAISNEMRDCARAKDNSQPANTRGGASAISNLGMYGVREFRHHQSAACHDPRGRRPAAPAVEAEDACEVCQPMTVTLSRDHSRVVDGALAPNCCGVRS